MQNRQPGPLDTPLGTLKGLREWIQQSAASQPFTEPDEDWVPTAFLVGRRDIAVVGMPALASTTDSDAKDLVIRTLGEEARRAKTVVLGLVVSAWVTRVEKADFDSGNWVMPSESPNRTEELVVYVLSRFDLAQTSAAEIIRHPSGPPTLGPWNVRENFDLVSRFNVLRDYLVPAAKRNLR